WFRTCHLLPRAISPRPRSARRSGRLALPFGNGTNGTRGLLASRLLLAPGRSPVNRRPTGRQLATETGRPCAGRGGGRLTLGGRSFYRTSGLGTASAQINHNVSRPFAALRGTAARKINNLADPVSSPPRRSARC